MTYNIFMGGRKGAALHEVIREAAPDVLLVNEIPSFRSCGNGSAPDCPSGGGRGTSEADARPGPT